MRKSYQILPVVLGLLLCISPAQSQEAAIGVNVINPYHDQSKLNRHTPIMTAGFGTYDQDDGDLPGWAALPD